MNNPLENQWALILGASSGFGAATCRELARAGMNIFGVHMDRRSTLGNVEELRSQIEECGKQSVFFNINAASTDKREAALDVMADTLQGQNPPTSIRVFLHSLAFGSLGRFFPTDSSKPITQDQMKMTLDVMAHSLVYWVQSLVRRELMGKESRIFAMTSAGGHRVWHSYGPVSAATIWFAA